MPRRLCLFALVVLGPVSLAACGGDDRERTISPATGDAATTVSVDDMAFSPKTVEIPAGEAVVWVWVGRAVHDVVFDDGPASRKQASSTWQRAFERPGSFHYVCTLHPNMRGTVVVR